MMVLFIFQPVFKLQEDINPCSPQTPLPVPEIVPSFISVKHSTQKVQFCISLFTSYYKKPSCKGETHNLLTILIVDVLL